MFELLRCCPTPLVSFFQAVGIFGDQTVGGVLINGEEFTTVKLIGEGGYAFVYEGISTANGQKVALKRYVLTDEHQKTNAMNELKIYQSVCPNPYIVSYITSDTVQRPRVAFPEIWVVMELCCGPSLQDFINNKIKMAQKFSFNEIGEIVDQLVCAICHLHSRSPPVSHWDIKPDNLLFCENGALKLCDFNSASQIFYQPKTPLEISTAEIELEEKMTLLYRAPESLDLWSKKRIDTKADIWSLGVLIYVLVYLEMPFEASAADIVDAVPKRFKDNSDVDTPEHAKTLMEIVMNKMLVKDPSKRADIFEVLASLSPIMKMSSKIRQCPPVEQQKSRW